MKVVSFIVVLLFLFLTGPTTANDYDSAHAAEQPCRKTVIFGVVKIGSRPVSAGAEVALLNNGVQVQTTLTDAAGNYRFIVERGKFRVRVDRTPKTPRLSREVDVNCGTVLIQGATSTNSTGISSLQT